MNIAFSIGEEDFRSIREENSYYVDKTHLLSEMLDSRDKVTLITRPRRFGKSLMLSTMEEFFAIQNDKEETKKLFDGLAIMEREDLAKEYMANYPVMHFSFNGVRGESYDNLQESILLKMKNWCIRSRKIFDFDKCDGNDVDSFERVRMGQACPAYDETEKGKKILKEDMVNFLTAMIRMLYDSYGKKVIVLLDEYDVPLAKASVMDELVDLGKGKYVSAYTAIKQFMSGLFGSALKDNSKLLKRAVITGCMRIARASIFTGINNFRWYGIQEEIYGDALGFTPQEVEKLLADTGILERSKDFKEWYDGYVFGRSEIYCPWDVLIQADIFQKKPRQKIKAHWLGTSENEILRQMLIFDIEEESRVLLAGGSITAKISNHITYDYLHASKDNLWMVLYQTGYLTKESLDDNGSLLRLVIPNKVIKKGFEEKFIEWKVENSGRQVSLCAYRKSPNAQFSASDSLKMRS